MNKPAIFGIFLVVLLGFGVPSVAKAQVSSSQAASTERGDIFQTIINEVIAQSSASASASSSNNEQKGNLKVIVHVENGCSENFEIRINDNRVGNMQGCNEKTFRVNADVSERLRVCALSTDSFLEGCDNVVNSKDKKPEHAYIYVN